MLRPKATRVLALAGLVLAGFLYWKPAQSYLHTSRELKARNAEVRALHEERERLRQRIAQAGTGGQLVREARRLGLVKPGEQLFIVRGINQWRKHH